MAAEGNAAQSQQWVDKTLGFCAVPKMEIGGCRHLQRRMQLRSITK